MRSIVAPRAQGRSLLVRPSLRPGSFLPPTVTFSGCRAARAPRRPRPDRGPQRSVAARGQGSTSSDGEFGGRPSQAVRGSRAHGSARRTTTVHIRGSTRERRTRYERSAALAISRPRPLDGPRRKAAPPRTHAECLGPPFTHRRITASIALGRTRSSRLAPTGGGGREFAAVLGTGAGVVTEAELGVGAGPWPGGVGPAERASRLSAQGADARSSGAGLVGLLQSGSADGQRACG